MVVRLLLILLAIAVIVGVLLYFQPPVLDTQVDVQDHTLTADVARRAVVSVWSTFDGEVVSQGSGFVVSADGLIITSHHVLKDGDATYIKFDSGVSSEEYEVTVIAFDKDYEIALLKIGAEHLQILPFAPGKARQGHPVWAMGYPSSGGLDTERMTITSGIISRINPDENSVPLIIQTDAYITYGSSGGPLYDHHAGGVVGVCSWAQHDEDDEPLTGINYAISIEKVIELFGEYL